jgi:phosphosulfolactate phosphohydrolase-like enzyme
VLDRVAANGPVLIACAGQEGRFALEDAAFAGWLCERLAQRGAALAGPEARLARTLAPRDAGEVRAVVEGSSHGRALRRLGADFARDVAFCAGLDSIGEAFEL